MKMTKKWLLAAAAVMFVASFGFMGCGADDDDDYNLITRIDSDNFEIEKTNDTSSTQRGYKSTKNQHNGGLVTITMDKDCENAGAMGYIFDLEEEPTGNRARDAKKERRFCIVGFNWSGTQVRPYVSMYEGVTDIEAQNFGATADNNTNATPKEGEDDGTEKPAVEHEYLVYGDSASNYTPSNTDNGVIVTVDIYADGVCTWDGTKRKYTSYNGGYVVDIYDGLVTADEIAGAASTLSSRKHQVKITATDLDYDDTKIPTQQTCAAYANLYAGKTLKGSWVYQNTYNAAEVIEDAE